MTAQVAQEKYRLDYCPPHYWIDSIDLDFHLDDHQTRVTAIKPGSAVTANTTSL